MSTEGHKEEFDAGAYLIERLTKEGSQPLGDLTDELLEKATARNTLMAIVGLQGAGFVVTRGEAPDIRLELTELGEALTFRLNSKSS